MLHEQFSRWLVALHKIILAHHDEVVTANVPFVFLVVTWKHFPLENLWVWCYVHPLSAFMAPPFLFLTGTVSKTSECTHGLWGLRSTWKQQVLFCSFWNSCQYCHSNKLESLFECEVSRLLYDEGEVEYWMYEPVDLTEQSSTNAATGATMQGEAVCTSMVLWFYHTV